MLLDQTTEPLQIGVVSWQWVCHRVESMLSLQYSLVNVI